VQRRVATHVTAVTAFLLASGLPAQSVSTADVNVSAQWTLAFETGTWTMRAGGKGPVLISGRYSAQWVKRDGKWLIRSEVFVALDCSGKGCSSRALP
jgi:hypothetical protein